MKRTSTILTIPTLLHPGAAEPLSLFGGRETLEVGLLTIVGYLCTIDQCLFTGLYLYHIAENLDELVYPGGRSSPHHPLRGYGHLIGVKM